MAKRGYKGQAGDSGIAIYARNQTRLVGDVVVHVFGVSVSCAAFFVVAITHFFMSCENSRERQEKRRIKNQRHAVLSHIVLPFLPLLSC